MIVCFHCWSEFCCSITFKGPPAWGWIAACIDCSDSEQLVHFISGAGTLWVTQRLARSQLGPRSTDGKTETSYSKRGKVFAIKHKCGAIKMTNIKCCWNNNCTTVTCFFASLRIELWKNVPNRNSKIVSFSEVLFLQPTVELGGLCMWKRRLEINKNTLSKWSNNNNTRGKLQGTDWAFLNKASMSARQLGLEQKEVWLRQGSALRLQCSCERWGTSLLMMFYPTIHKCTGIKLIPCEEGS